MAEGGWQQQTKEKYVTTEKDAGGGAKEGRNEKEEKKDARHERTEASTHTRVYMTLDP